MTVFNATRSRPARRPLLLRNGSVGLLVGAMAAISAVHAGTPAGSAVHASAFAAQVAPAASVDPAKQVPGAISVSNIDFKRGDGGAGRLVLKFSGEGAAPDLRNQGSKVVINVGNAQLPASLQRPLNVSDFATPVQQIEARASGGGTQLVLDTSGNYESMAYQTGSEYIVEILPRAAAPAGRAVGASGSNGTSDAVGGTKSYSGRPVTFNFQDVPVRTVLQLVAEESSLNVVAADTVTGNVTLRLINVPWDQALDIVLQAKGLDKRRSGNVIWVAPQAEIAKYEQDREDARIAIDNRVDLVTEYVQINYHNATAIFKALTEAKGIGGGAGAGTGGNVDSGFLSPRGRLVADERTNTLMISDIPKKITQMKELIHVIDRPVDQVVIEARVVVANESFSRELGAKFGLSGVTNSGKAYFNSTVANNVTTQNSFVNAANQNRNNTGGPRVLPVLTRGLMTDLGVANPAGSIALAILNAGYALDVELSALQEEGRGEVISNPRIVTSNQREAIISQGREIPYQTVEIANGVATTTIEFKPVVLEMKVTPTITNDGRVFLNMIVKKDELERTVQGTGGTELPLISTRTVNTAVLVEDGQTVVVGGVYEFRNASDVTKVPFLGDIPFLGNLFKKKARSNDKAELLIMVTPKVLKVAQR
ncbi:type IV pilus secretin PilQ [Montanilutibacter psychrotolerans]|uniref:Type IV pilus secretin PilQ family protein n=1 Tax=Montanilutibacter psychrotolerans TaxID=1327343 RepID=A0A3M8T302_9GAMM|nr:type IV pilus secretin PilQ family protein [Lysobacter psychrotolerans]RNF85904.1 type IV pilus secretin PilQ family protein [Lysobacter psychrotolerans]